MFYKLIQFIEIDIGKKLAVQVADGEPFAGWSIKKSFVAGELFQKMWVSAQIGINGAIVKNKRFCQPPGIRVGAAFTYKEIECFLIYTHKIITDIQLQIPGPAIIVARYLPYIFLKTGNTFMNTFPLAAGIRCVDKNWFPKGFEIIHQNMVHNTIPKICSKYFTQFRFVGKKADRTTWSVGVI
jgi:hypothetical protein